MTPVWFTFDARDAFTTAILATLRNTIEEAVRARGRATLALSGGRTPVAILGQLAALDLPWAAVTLIPCDDRLVTLGDPLSNAGMLTRTFAGTTAQVLPLVDDTIEYHDAGRRADARLQALDWPLDFVWLGMGADGHTASIFPGPDLASALDAAPTRRAVGVRPDPLPPEAPVNRVTLTAGAILAARQRILVIEGEAKRQVLDAAIAEGPASEYPIAQLMARGDGPLDVYWLR